MDALEKAHQHVRQAREVLGRTHDGKAAGKLLQAAYSLYSAALQSTEDDRQRRMKLAGDLARLARDVSQARADARSGRSSVAQLPECTQIGPSTIRFEDVVGLDDAKDFIRRAVMLPLRHPDIAREFGVKTGGGLMLFGPPGTGKTMLARAVAGELECPFYAVDPAFVMGGGPFNAESRLRSVFTQARRDGLAVIYCDEAEALMPSRRDNRSTVMARLVPQMLQELDGITDHSDEALLFIATTNRPDRLDSAVLRPGRLGLKVYVGPPSPAERRVMFERNLAHRRCDDIDFTVPVELTGGYTGADIKWVCEEAVRHSFVARVSEPGATGAITAEAIIAEILKIGPSAPPELEAEFHRLADSLGVFERGV